MEAISGIRKHFDTLNTIKGTKYSYTVPTKEEIEIGIHSRLHELEKLLKRVPFKWEHAQRALQRIMAETPPNGPQNQQFKDSAIWEAILELSRLYTIHWITNDMGFFKDGKPEKGLAANLLDDCKKIETEIYPYNDLVPCLQALTKKVVALNSDAIGKEIGRRIIEDLRRSAYRENLAVEDRPEVKLQAFPTAKNEILALSYQMTYPVIDLMGGPYTQPTGGTLEVIGSASYNTNNETVEDARLEKIEMTWVDAQGRLRKPRTSVLYGTDVSQLRFGHGYD
jgi:hypothetical protein